MATMVELGKDAGRWESGFAKLLLARLLQGAALFCGACEDPDAFDELTDEYRLSAIGPNVLVTPSPNSNAGLETSAVGFPSTNRVFVSYNSQDSELSCGWSHSSNGGGSFTSTDHLSTPLPGFLGSDGSAFTKCLGDTWSADVSHSLGSPMVAMVAVTKHAGSGGCNGSWYDVGMWTGAPNAFPSPGNVLLLSDQLGSGGCTDGPKIGWDPTNHKAWVWWWDDGRTFLRPVAVLNNGTMIPGATIELTGELMADEKHATIAIKPGAGGAPPWIWLAYPTVVGDEDLKPCSVPGNWQTTAVTWWLSRSINDGADWTHLQIDHDPAWPFCLSANPLGGNRAIVSPIFEPNSGRLMLSYSRHIDDENGDFVGTRVVTKMWPNKNNNQNLFTTWIPICNPDVCPNPPPTGKSCLVNGAPPAGESVCHQYGPGVGVKSSGTRRFAAVFHDTRDSDDFGFPNPDVGETGIVNPLLSDIWGYSIRAGNLAGPEYTLDRITPLVGNVPWAETSTDGNLWWGDYEDGVMGFGSRFHAVWGDDRDIGDGTTKLMGAAFNE